MTMNACLVRKHGYTPAQRRRTTMVLDGQRMGDERDWVLVGFFVTCSSSAEKRFIRPAKQDEMGLWLLPDVIRFDSFDDSFDSFDDSFDSFDSIHSIHSIHSIRFIRFDSFDSIHSIRHSFQRFLPISWLLGHFSKMRSVLARIFDESSESCALIFHSRKPPMAQLAYSRI